MAALSSSWRSSLRATLDAVGLVVELLVEQIGGTVGQRRSGCRPVRRRWSVSLCEAMVNR